MSYMFFCVMNDFTLDSTLLNFNEVEAILEKLHLSQHMPVIVMPCNIL